SYEARPAKTRRWHGYRSGARHPAWAGPAQRPLRPRNRPPEANTNRTLTNLSVSFALESCYCRHLLSICCGRALRKAVSEINLVSTIVPYMLKSLERMLLVTGFVTNPYQTIKDIAWTPIMNWCFPFSRSRHCVLCAGQHGK